MTRDISFVSEVVTDLVRYLGYEMEDLGTPLNAQWKPEDRSGQFKGGTTEATWRLESRTRPGDYLSVQAHRVDRFLRSTGDRILSERSLSVEAERLGVRQVAAVTLRTDGNRQPFIAIVREEGVGARIDTRVGALYARGDIQSSRPCRPGFIQIDRGNPWVKLTRDPRVRDRMLASPVPCGRHPHDIPLNLVGEWSHSQSLRIWGTSLPEGFEGVDHVLLRAPRIPAVSSFLASLRTSFMRAALEVAGSLRLFTPTEVPLAFAEGLQPFKGLAVVALITSAVYLYRQ